MDPQDDGAVTWAAMVIHLSSTKPDMPCLDCRNSSTEFRENVIQESFSQRRQFERSLGYIVGPALVSMNAVSLLANAVILSVQCRRGIHSRTAVVVINLVINDILLLCIGTPWKLVVYTSDSWSLGAATCKLAVYALMLTLHVEVYTLLLMACLRYIAIAKPFSATVYLTNTKVYILIWAVWIISIFVNIPAGMFATLKSFSIHNTTEELCIKMSVRSISYAEQIYGKCHFVLTYTVPLVVIFALLGVSIRKLDQSRSCSVGERTYIRKRTYAIYRLVALTVTYAVCVLPINTMLMLRFLLVDIHINSKQFVIAEICALFFAFIKCLIHPILYNCMAEDFRKDTILMIKRRSTCSSDLINNFNDRRDSRL